MIKSQLSPTATKLKIFQAVALTIFCAMSACSVHASGAFNKMLRVTTKQDAGGVTHFYVQNVEAADVTATFQLNLLNMACSTNVPLTRTFAGNSTVEAFTLSPVKAGEPWNFSYKDSFTIGDVNAVHDDSFIYRLPYQNGKSYRVTQGYHGSFSHTGPDEYAIDFKMPIGTPVYAARGGTVVKVKDDSNFGGPNRKYEEEANLVLIQHADGTIGIYAHLKQHSSKVHVGDKVNAGDPIASSGNTGFTSGPHLHFSVFKTRSGHERLSLPVKFQTASGVEMTLAEGQSYRAVPGQASNEVQVAKAPMATQPIAQ